MSPSPRLRPRPTRPRTPRSPGYTLIEMLVVIAIVGILAAMAVPMFDSFIARTQVNDQISTLASSLRQARSEALKRNIQVTLCPSDDADSEAPTCAAAADGDIGWAAGWIAYAGAVVPTGDADADRIVLRQPAFASSGGIMPAQAGYTITYFPNGTALGGAGSFTFRPKGGEADPDTHRRMCISAQGSSRLTDDANCN